MKEVIQLRNHHLKRGRNNDKTPIYPVTKPEAILGLDKYLSKAGTGVVPFDSMPEEVVPGTIYYNTAEDKYYISNASGALKPIESSGKSAYDIAVDNGFEGTEVEWLASLKGEKGDKGDQGNSSYTGDVGELEIVENAEEGGIGKAASAEVVKNIAIQTIPDTGSFSDAYSKSKISNVVFPWILNETDEGGNQIRKMIWHIGNGEFVDAIGSTIIGKREGITINSDGNGVLEVMGGGYEGITSNQSAPIGIPAKLSFSAGTTNYDFDEIKNAFIAANQSLYETAIASTGDDTALKRHYNAIKNYDGKSLSTSCLYTGRVHYPTMKVSVDDEDPQKATYVDIDMGGVVIKGVENTYGPNDPFIGLVNVFFDSTDSVKFPLIRRIERLNVQGTKVYLLSRCPDLKEMHVSGNVSGLLRLGVGNYDFSGLEKVDIKDLEVENTCTSVDMFNGNAQKKFTSLDLRNIDTSGATALTKFCYNCTDLETLIIGNFSNESLSGLNNFLGSVSLGALSNITLVCTTDEPPVLNSSYDWVANHFSTIKVPNKTIEVNGEEVTVLSLYQNAAGWSTYASIMETYEDWEY